MKLDPISTAFVIFAIVLIGGIAVSALAAFLVDAAMCRRQQRDVECCMRAARDETTAREGGTRT